MAFTQDFRTQRRNYNDGETRIGEKDRLWYDSNTNTIRISDGVTPGGTVIGSGGAGGDYVLPTASTTVRGGVKIDGSTITIANQVISVGTVPYSSLSGTPTIPTNNNELTNGAAYITSAALSGLATETYVTTRGYLTSVGTISYNDLSNKPTLFSGSYSDLTNKPTIYSSAYIGTTSLDFTRASGTQTLSGVSISGNAGTVTNGVYTTDTGTVTNAMLAGSIANNKLTNSSITVNGTDISLGSSATILAANPNALTIGTGLSGTNYTGASAVTIALASGYGDTQNPYASKTANYFLAAPNGSNGAPTFRAIVAADIPTLNQNTTGSAATLTTARNINGVSFNGGAAINIPTLTDGTNSIKITAVPASIYGAPGDVVGSVAFDSTYIYYCFQAFTGTSYSLPVISGLGEFSERVNAGSSELRTAIVAAFAATPAGWSYGGYPVNNITAASGSSINIFRDYGSPISNGVSYTLIQPSATANWKITPWGATTSAAAAGSLTGNTLASGVTASSLTSVGTLTSLSSGAITTTGTLAVNASSGITTNQTTFSLINSSATTVNFAGAAITLSVGAATGTTTINNNLSMASGKTIGTTATVTSNHATAFSAGDSAISNVALSVPRDAAIRDRTNGASVIYFDVSSGGTTNGEFQFRSNSAFTNVLTMSPTGFNVNTNAVVTARTPSLARTAFNAAMGTELTVDEMRFRITNSGLVGIFPQVIGNGSARNLAWTVVAARSGSAVNQAGSTGTIVASDAWTTLYNLGGMDSSGDTFTATLQDKGAGRIYRVTFMRSDQAGGDGFSIIAERLL